MKFLWVLIVVAALVAADDNDDDDTQDVGVDNSVDEAVIVDEAIVSTNSSTGGRSRSRPNERFFGGLGNIIGAGAALLGGVLGGGRPVRPQNSQQGFGGGFQGGNPGFQGGNPGFQGGNPGFQGGNPGFQGGNPGFQGGNPGFQGGNPGFQGGSPGFQGGNPGFQGGNPGFQGGNPGFQGGNPGFQGGNPGFQGGNPGFQGGNPGFQNGNPGFGGQVTGGCRYWCRTPQGQAYCCENSNQAASLPFTKPGQCPPVRPSCPPTRFSQGPPQTCSNDSRCPGVDKCCFDTCLQEHVCKPPLGIGK